MKRFLGLAVWAASELGLSQIEVSYTHTASSEATTYFVFRTQPETIIIEHRRAFFPCCLSLAVELTLQNDELTIQEIDNSPPCLCPLVPFDVAITLVHVPPGEYRVRLLDPLARFLAGATLRVVSKEYAVFIRGDVNGDGTTNLADAIACLLYLFRHAELTQCPDSADANDDGRIDIADAIRLLEYLFAGGAQIPPPFPDRGSDPTEDPTDCSGISEIVVPAQL